MTSDGKKAMAAVLLVGGEHAERDQNIAALAEHGLRAAAVPAGTGVLASLAGDAPAVVVLIEPVSDSGTLIDELVRRSIPVIVASSTADVSSAVQALRGGASDYLVKDASFLERLPQAIRAALAPAERNKPGDTELLRESEERFRMVADATAAGIWSWDLVRGTGFWSQRAFEIAGIAPRPAAPSPAETLELVHPDDRQSLVEEIARAARAQERCCVEFRLVRPDASTAWLRTYATATLNENRQPLRFFGCVVDVSQRKRVEEELSQSEERYRLLVEHAPDAILVHRDGPIVFVNPACVQLYGAKSAAELVGRNIIDFAHPDFVEVILRRRRAVLDERRVAPPLAQKGFRLDGSEMDVEATVTPCLYDGQPAAQVMLRDISDRVAAERQARQHHAELAHVQRLTTMGNMVSELAHEINQPLYAISNYAAACRDVLENQTPLPTREITGWIRNISDQSRRAGDIIRRLSRFVRKDTSRRATIRAEELICDVMALVDIDARRHDVRVHVELDDCDARLLVDRVGIEQVMVNLMLNAIEAMQAVDRSRRELGISCAVEDGKFRVGVSDTGPGVDAETLPRLGDAFYTTKPSGMGMGLHISRSIVESHGGQLWAEPNADRGMTFYFTLPTHEEAARGV